MKLINSGAYQYGLIGKDASTVAITGFQRKRQQYIFNIVSAFAP
jgi:hypothetical protein